MKMLRWVSGFAVVAAVLIVFFGLLVMHYPLLGTDFGTYYPYLIE